MRDLVVRLQQTRTMKSAVSFMAEIGDRLGLPMVSVIEDCSRTTILEDEDGHKIAEPFDWPAGFAEHWVRENYTVYFPCAPARFGTLPYLLNYPIAARDEQLLPRQRRVLRELAGVGLVQSINVPVHLPCAQVAIVSWQGRKDGTESEQALEMSGELMAAAYFFMDLARRLREAHLPPPRLPQLSPRELECLAWAARGKSDQDIATICGLSPATVRCYIDTAGEKLDASTRTHAVALASELGLLHGARGLRH